MIEALVSSYHDSLTYRTCYRHGLRSTPACDKYVSMVRMLRDKFLHCDVTVFSIICDIGRQDITKSRFVNMFNNFGHEREVGDRTVVRELVLVQSALLEKTRYG